MLGYTILRTETLKKALKLRRHEGLVIGYARGYHAQKIENLNRMLGYDVLNEAEQVLRERQKK